MTYTHKLLFEGTVSVVSSVSSHEKKTMPDLQRYLWNLNQIKNVEDNIVFQKVFFSTNFFSFKQEILNKFMVIYFKAFKGTDVNRASPFVHACWVTWNYAYGHFKFYSTDENDKRSSKKVLTKINK